MFNDTKPSHSLLINGAIRAGRADADKTRLAKEISSSSSRIAGISEAHILVSIDDLPARFAVEGGRVMPEPGAEKEWFEPASRSA
jgi:phenylpyruvate tautomerase PptA (4-oxalocrotonate tautomerase family)